MSSGYRISKALTSSNRAAKSFQNAPFPKVKRWAFSSLFKTAFQKGKCNLRSIQKKPLFSLLFAQFLLKLFFVSALISLRAQYRFTAACRALKSANTANPPNKCAICTKIMPKFLHLARRNIFAKSDRFRENQAEAFFFLCDFFLFCLLLPFLPFLTFIVFHKAQNFLCKP